MKWYCDGGQMHKHTVLCVVSEGERKCAWFDCKAWYCSMQAEYRALLWAVKFADPDDDIYTDNYAVHKSVTHRIDPPVKFARLCRLIQKQVESKRIKVHKVSRTRNLAGIEIERRQLEDKRRNGDGIRTSYVTEADKREAKGAQGAECLVVRTQGMDVQADRP